MTGTPTTYPEACLPALTDLDMHSSGSPSPTPPPGPMRVISVHNKLKEGQSQADHTACYTSAQGQPSTWGTQNGPGSHTMQATQRTRTGDPQGSYVTSRGCLHPVLARPM
ncbi:Hypothetical predicted protein [Pelobates cultripes]|uniref:Uncharacterized protein n=1 Tax=Pelobates cultripes TaxID=61616 RepID=A0AAD1SGN2_PELCU|nr:Hypothetical predicted protein [Pelobates cultripes]